MIKINKKEKDELRNRLYERDGRECYYCGIKEEDFIPIWGKFYGGRTRGQKLEVDRSRIVWGQVLKYNKSYIIFAV